jgi:ubiquinone/menaquinone biosynthesis C-methylase UbiE
MATPQDVHNPLFARLYSRMSARAEQKGQAEHRRELLAGATGRAIEVGAGHGLNFKHYPDSVTEVVAVEPEPYLRELAAKAAGDAPVPVRVVGGLADSLPAEDGEFDVGVASLMLCSVPDQATALAEFHRVIRSGGELRFYEHVIADRRGLARFQRMVRPGWKLVAGGCNPDRDTAAAIEAAGFTIDHIRRFDFVPAPVELPAKPRILGRARRS